MSTIQQELVIKARADVSDAKKGLASLDQSVDGDRLSGQVQSGSRAVEPYVFSTVRIDARSQRRS